MNPQSNSAALIPLVFSGTSNAVNEEREWERIAGELEAAEEETSSEEKTYRVDYLTPIKPGEPVYRLRSSFPLERVALEAKMKDEIETLYCLHGSDALFAFSEWIGKSVDPKLHAFDDGYPPDSPEANEQYGSRVEIIQAMRLVYDESVTQREALFASTAKLRDRIQTQAAAIADKQLDSAGVEILTEASRYLALSRRTTIAAQKYLETTTSDPAYTLLRGPDLPVLVGAIRRIQSRCAVLERGDPSGAQRPNGGSALEDAVDDLALSVMVQGRRFPVLHRIWQRVQLSSDVRVDLYTHPEPSLKASTRRGGREIAVLRDAVFTTLQDAWKSNTSLRIELQNNPEMVWRFPPLIQSALTELSKTDTNFAALSPGARAAEERMVVAQSMRITTILSLITGGLDLIMLAAGAAPPIGLVIAGVNLLLTVLDSVLEFFILRAEDWAYKAVHDPQKVLAHEPSYFGFVLGVAFSLLDVKAVRDAIRATRYAQEAAELGKLGEAR